MPSSADFGSELDIPKAVAAELGWEPDLIPKPIADRALADKAEPVADHLRQLLLGNHPFSVAPIVFARKWRLGRRPVSAMPLYERSLYRAVVDLLSPDLAPLERGGDFFTEFEAAPLAQDNQGYVVMTDLANYYTSINLDRLCGELVQRTGRWDAISWLRTFWTRVSGGYGGIPQMSQSSDIIGDTFADELHRALVRHGKATWRYADDFRVLVSTEAEAIETLELFDEEARRLGLFLNERKTRILPYAHYESYVRAPEAHLATISTEVDEDLSRFDPYGMPTLPPDELESLREVSLRLITFWHDEQDDRRLSAGQSVEAVRLLKNALGVLTRLGDHSALSLCSDILRIEPQLTPGVCRYLEAIAVSVDSQEVANLLAKCLHEVPLTKWQQIWFLRLLEYSKMPRNVPIESDMTILKWMRSCVGDNLEPLRCQAAWSLACRFDLALSEWQGLRDRGGAYTEAFLAAASLGTSGLWGKAKSSPTGQLDRMICQWVEEKCLISPF